MTCLLLAPHNDDETLFASFLCIRERPHVIVVLRSQTQDDRFGVTAATREEETLAATDLLGCTYEQWNYRDAEPDWAAIELKLRSYRAFAKPQVVFAPAREPQGGNPHHDRIAVLADGVFGPELVTHYLTYTTAGKSTWGVPVEYEPEWVERKMAALACYRSQASLANCAEHFLRDQHEYLAA